MALATHATRAVHATMPGCNIGIAAQQHAGAPQALSVPAAHQYKAPLHFAWSVSDGNVIKGQQLQEPILRTWWVHSRPADNSAQQAACGGAGQGGGAGHVLAGIWSAAAAAATAGRSERMHESIQRAGHKAVDLYLAQVVILLHQASLVRHGTALWVGVHCSIHPQTPYKPQSAASSF